jgi:hypothetical protein
MSAKYTKGKDGKLLTNNIEIMKRWREYFLELLDGTEEGTNLTAEEQVNTLQVKGEKGKDDDIKEGELEMAIKKVKVGKMAGYDKIAPEMVKYMCRTGRILLLKVIRIVWKTRMVPRKWNIAIIIPIYKKGDNRLCQKHRGISLLRIPGNIYERIFESRLRSNAEDQVDESQCGFRPNRSTQDLIFALIQISEKTIKYGKEVHLCFLDLVKAFARVPRSELWKY